MIVLVETIALERDADLREDLLDGGATHVGFAVVGLRANRQRVVGERLPDLEHVAGALAAVVIGRHGSEDTGVDVARHRTMARMWLVLGVLAAYIVGTFPSALWVGRRAGTDPTTAGSRNPGASNVYRLSGRRAGVLVGVIDALKGAVPVAIALVVADRPEAHAVWAAAVAGHVWPVFRRFRGGKGVATAGGGGLVISPIVGIGCAVLFFGVVKFGRVAALGSLTIAVAYPIISAAIGRPAWEVAVGAGIAAILVVRHQSNIRRLLGRSEERV